MQLDRSPTGFWCRGLLSLLWLLVSGCQLHSQPLSLQPAAVESYRQNVQYLTSDEMEGRGPNTQGIDLAANYLEGYFRGLGLRPPPGQKSYSQPFTFTTIIGPSQDTWLKTGDCTWSIGHEYLPLAFSGDGRFAAPVVFAGYGITAGSDNASGVAYDDYAGVDLEGKVALVMRFEPHHGGGRSRLAKDGWSPHAAVERKARLAAEHGAVALLVVHPPNFHGSDQLTPLAHKTEQQCTIPVIHIRQQVANALFMQSGAIALREFQREIDNNFSPRSFELKRARVQGNVAMYRKTYNLRNVAACIPGKGKYAREYVVIGAHYDHLGYAPASPSSSRTTTRPIYRGADDNASGTAAVLELARIFSDAPRPQRSLLFVCFSGEELGLLGSQYWVDHPPVPLKQITAMFNFDMIGRIRNDTLYVGGMGTSTAFPGIIKQADDASPLILNDLKMWNSGKAPSDCTPFANRQIPVLFFWSGMHTDLHRTTDVANKINFAGATEAINVAAQVIATVLQRDDITFPQPSAARPTTTKAK